MKIDILGLQINTEPKKEILKIISERVQKGKKTFIVTPYSEFFYFAAKNFNFREVINNATLAIPDGISIQWLTYYLAIPFSFDGYYTKILQGIWQLAYTNFAILFAPQTIKKVIKEKIPGSDFFWDLVALADANRLRIFLLGGFGDTPEIVKNKIQIKFPNCVVAGISNSGPADPHLVGQINNSGADLLFVAFGPETQEMWINKNFEQLEIKIAIGVGGTFDYIAGKKLLPPRLVRRIGLEWLYRLFTQPTRIKRIWHAYVDLLKGALRYKVFMTMPFRENAVGVIINKENKIFTVTRDPNFKNQEVDWWLPQGGIDEGENCDQAALREVAEETGILPKNLTILGHAPENYSFIWPHYLRPLFANKRRFKGQQQTFVFLKYAGDGSDIDLTRDPNPEINNFGNGPWVTYKWVSIEEFKNILIPMRKIQSAPIFKSINKYLQ